MILFKIFLFGFILINLSIGYFSFGYYLYHKNWAEIQFLYLSAAPHFSVLLILFWPVVYSGLKKDIRRGRFKG